MATGPFTSTSSLSDANPDAEDCSNKPFILKFMERKKDGNARSLKAQLTGINSSI
jgi:hypothetical protein